MKKFILAILTVLSLFNTGYANPDNSGGASRFVLALSGLRLRDVPNGNIITTIPYGEVVVVEDDPHKVAITVEGLEGFWAKVKWKGQSGWVFNGFLSRFPAPAADCISSVDYAKRYFTPVTGELKTQFSTQFAEYSTTTVQIFVYNTDTITLSQSSWDGSGGSDLVFPHTSVQEIYLIAKALYRQDYQNKALSFTPTGDNAKSVLADVFAYNGENKDCYCVVNEGSGYNFCIVPDVEDNKGLVNLFFSH